LQTLLAIDQSTSATKAVLFDTAGRVLERASCQHRQVYPQPGWAEHSAQEIWQNTLAVTREVLNKTPPGTREVVSVSIANQRETIVVFDRRTGIPLAPAIVWQCRRGEDLCALQATVGRDTAIRQRTGLYVDSYFSASKIQWMIRECPGIAERLHLGSALIGTIDTYLIYRLTGGAVFATDHTNSSRTLLYDIHRRRWDEELCEWWQVPMHALAQIRASDAHFGDTNFEGLLARAAPIRGVMGDSQAALFSHRCLEVGSVKVTLGTGASILVNTGNEVPSASRGTLAALAWMRGDRATYALEGIITSCASTLSWLSSQLGILDDPTDSESVAREVADEDDSVYVVPAFSGLGAPYWSSAARAAIVGLSAHSDRRHIVRAGLESIAYQLRDVLDMMRTETGLELPAIRADGGPTLNRYLMQVVADVVRVDVHVSRALDGAASGAALMGGLGAGIVNTPESFPAQGDEVIYRPAMAPERAQARYAGWLRAVRQVLGAT
jgi:glycerol kinase